VVPNWESTPSPVAVVVVPLLVTAAPLDEEPEDPEELEELDELDDVVKEMDGSLGLNMSTPVVPTIVATSTMGARRMGFSQRARVRGNLKGWRDVQGWRG